MKSFVCSPFLCSMVALVFTVFSSPARSEGVGNIENMTRHVIAGVVKFEVHCDDGHTEVATPEMIRFDNVCGGSGEFFYDPQMKIYWRLIPGNSTLSDSTCSSLGRGWRVPTPVELREAILRGIGTPQSNPAFGYKLSKESVVFSDARTATWNGSNAYLYDVTIFDFTNRGLEKQLHKVYASTKGATLCAY